MMNHLLFLFLLPFHSPEQVTVHEIHQRANDGKPPADSIPAWVRQLYEQEGDFLNNAIPDVIYYKKLTDSTSYCLYEVSDGVCLYGYAATQKNKKPYRSMEIQRECDADYSQTEYSYTSYEHDSLNLKIKLTTGILKAKAKYLVRENNTLRFKEGYNLESAETNAYEETKTIRVKKSGELAVEK